MQKSIDNSNKNNNNSNMLVNKPESRRDNANAIPRPAGVSSRDCNELKKMLQY